MTPHVHPQRRDCLIVTIGVTFIFAGLIARSARGLEPESISWRDDYGSALEEARAANRLLWIQFTGPWCPNCTRMEHDSFPHPAIIEHARQSFVPLKLRSDVHEQLALDFNLSGLPATVLVAPNREVVAVHQGYLGPEQFDVFLRDALARHPGLATPKRRTTDDSTIAIVPARAGDTPRKKETQLALSGYCPVSLIKGHKLVQGQVQYTIQHEGLIYRFADRVMIDLFRKEPHRYVPLNGGGCPVTQLDKGTTRPGDPKWGVLVPRSTVPVRHRGRTETISQQPRALLHGRRRGAGILFALHRAVGSPRSRRLAARDHSRRRSVLVSGRGSPRCVLDVTTLSAQS